MAASSSSTSAADKATTVSDPNRPKPVLDATQNSFLVRMRTKTKDVDQHEAALESYLEKFEADHRDMRNNEGAIEGRRETSKTMTNFYYDLATDFYEYGWGRSFHFARMFKDSSFQTNLARHEDYLAMKMNLKPGMKVIDCGCGVGGPLREIAKFSGSHVTGLNYNEYQVKRCKYLAERFGLSSLCDAVHGDFCNM
ncbi:Delta(24)-sterol C-methyltransferase, partial [Cladochytrium tenue]